MHTKELLAEMKSEHDLWQKRISFFKSEILDFNRHLVEIVGSKIRDSKIMADVEHFQNQFIIQKERLDIIRHEFKEHENLIEGIQNAIIKEPKHGIKKIHEMQIDKLDQFEKVFHELRKEFNLFLDKTQKTIYQS